ncbi:DUF4013 domain-containing protein [Haloprofundus salilacus]|uniref:DUF4013 domain-containing protein n=1 Tax=Haloprofundus salilacus TaxID=2876190 RepID=UPI001CCA28EA|nr:DUF4013 domain-containing protein [Haloprofundus salilacus]
MSIALEADLRYPMNADDWVKTLLVGGVLSLAGVVLIPLFFVLGYYLRVARRSMRGDETPPSLTDWGTLFVDGVKAAVVLVVYQLVPLLAFGLTSAFLLIPVLTDGNVPMGVSVLGIVGGLLLSTLLSLAFGYFGIVGTLNVAREGTLGAGFDFGRVKRVAFDRGYAVQWLYAFVLSLGINALVGAVTAIPVIGWSLVLLTPLVSFYVGVVVSRIHGRGYASALDEENRRTGASAAETVT